MDKNRVKVWIDEHGAQQVAVNGVKLPSMSTTAHQRLEEIIKGRGYGTIEVVMACKFVKDDPRKK